MKIVITLKNVIRYLYIGYLVVATIRVGGSTKDSSQYRGCSLLDPGKETGN